MAREGDFNATQTRLMLAKCGVRFETLDEAALRDRYPQVRFAPKMWGVLEPDSGALMARRAVQTVVEQTVLAGATYRQEALVSPAGKGRLEAAITRHGGRIRAEVFVFACGPWLPKLFPNVLGRRIFPTRQEVFFLGLPAGDRRFAPSALPVWIDFSDERGPYGFPDLENRGFKIALDRHGPPFDPDTGNRVVRPEGLAEVRRYLDLRFPDVRDAPLLESRVCQYENTSSGDFLIDRHPELDNVWLIGGGSGHGFKHGPALGEYVAERILKGGPVEQRFTLATKAEVQKRAVY
jgi:glycine/D-amino acid oxidase-like deaminating enzyme